MSRGKLCSVAILLACLAACSTSAPPQATKSDEGEISPVEKDYVAPTSDWVRVSLSGPPVARVSAGGRLQLDCEANGSPPPKVQWFHNDKPVTPRQVIYDNENVGDMRLATVRARVFVDCVTPEDQGAYHCVATAASKTAVGATATVLVRGKQTSRQMSCNESAVAPRIVAWSPTVMETVGNDVVLPCDTLGEPKPSVYWVDSENRMITSDDESQNGERIKLLDSGYLMILAVRWEDMDLYSCIAESPLGRDATYTFLYPMAKDN